MPADVERLDTGTVSDIGRVIGDIIDCQLIVIAEKQAVFFPVKTGGIDTLFHLAVAPNPVLISVLQYLQVDSGLITLTADDVDILSSLFRERASLIPRRALSGETINLLRRLRLVD